MSILIYLRKCLCLYSSSKPRLPPFSHPLTFAPDVNKENGWCRQTSPIPEKLIKKTTKTWKQVLCFVNKRKHYLQFNMTNPEKKYSLTVSFNLKVLRLQCKIALSSRPFLSQCAKKNELATCSLPSLLYFVAMIFHATKTNEFIRIIQSILPNIIQKFSKQLLNKLITLKKTKKPQ